MPDLTARNLRRCAQCGKLIPLDEARPLCAVCARANGETAQASESEPFSDVTADTACSRCRLRVRLDGSEFCLNCQVEIVAELGETARELIVKLETLEEAPESHEGASETLRKKRRNTPTSHINVVGGQPLKWWVQR